MYNRTCGSIAVSSFITKKTDLQGSLIEVLFAYKDALLKKSDAWWNDLSTYINGSKIAVCLIFENFLPFVLLYILHSNFTLMNAMV